MSYKITLIPGDGIGPEITKATLKVLEATGIKFQWEEVLAGQRAIEKENAVLPYSTQESLIKNKIALKGPVTTPIGSGFESVNVMIRKKISALCQCPSGSKYRKCKIKIQKYRSGCDAGKYRESLCRDRT